MTTDFTDSTDLGQRPDGRKRCHSLNGASKPFPLGRKRGECGLSQTRYLLGPPEIWPKSEDFQFHPSHKVTRTSPSRDRSRDPDFANVGPYDAQSRSVRPGCLFTTHAPAVWARAAGGAR